MTTSTQPTSSAQQGSIYLNHAGTSWPKPASVVESMSAFAGLNPDQWPRYFNDALQKVADYFSVADSSRLLLTNTCTTALTLATQDCPLVTGDRVVISGWEHHALHRAVLKLVERGVRLDVIPPSEDSAVDLTRLEETLARGDVRLVAMTAACNVTGELLPIDEIVALAHRYDSLVLIDAAQVAGWFELDLRKLGADLVTFAGHKGMQAAWGVGGLYVAPEIAMNSPAASCEISAGSTERECQSMPGYCDCGSVNQLALASLAASIGWLQQSSCEARLANSRQQVELFYSAAEKLPNVKLFGTRSPERRLPTVAFRVQGRSVREVADQFRSAGIQVAAGLQCSPLAHETLGTAPDGAVRLSVGPCQAADDLERAAAVLREVAS